LRVLQFEDHTVESYTC